MASNLARAERTRRKEASMVSSMARSCSLGNADTNCIITFVNTLCEKHKRDNVSKHSIPAKNELKV